MSDNDIIHINDTQYKELVKAYDTAVIENKVQFTLFDQDVVTGFAKYWIEAVEADRRRRGLRLYKKNKKGIWIWIIPRKSSPTGTAST